MTGWRIVAAAMLAAAPAMASAQTAAPPTTAVDPARLAAARAVIDQIMPPASREKMIRGMMTAMVANIRQGMTGNAQFARTMGDDPRVKAIFERFMDRQMGRMTQMLDDGLPGMTEAMAKAYARRFDVAQLGEIAGFFRTPTGRIYMEQSMTIMSDPDVAAWQRTLMTQSMSHIQGDAAELAKQIDALPPAAGKP